MKTKIFILGLALTLQANFGAAQTAILPSENFKSDSGVPLSGWALANDSSLSSSLDSSKSSKSSGIATMAAADDTWTIDL
ncbi:MAG: hypothetical protein LBJ57_07760, partial [Prevotellaceae bacterium]|nr:hypothetical protein [Prevotellaceae bacterium]